MAAYNQHAPTTRYHSVTSISNVGGGRCSSSAADLLLMNPSQLTSSGVISCSDVLDAMKASVMMDPSDDCRPQQHHQQQQRQQLLQDQPDSYSNISLQNTGRMSPCYSNTYATLTSLHPLPPISTVAEKFGGGLVASNNSAVGNFVFMQNGELGLTGYGADVAYGYPEYSKESDVETDPGYGAMEPVSHVQGMSSATGSVGRYSSSSTSERTLYASFGSNAISAIKSELAAIVGDDRSPSSYRGGYASNVASVSQLAAAAPAAPTQTMMQHALSNLQSLQQQQVRQQQNCRTNNGGDPQQQQRRRRQQQMSTQIGQLRRADAAPSPIQQDQPSSSTDDVVVMHEAALPELEEIDTHGIARKVSNELKKYSIPQAVFAERILGRSQGTLSDLLRNPKPWSKLKSGRETFRRMWKWLQEAECRRLSQLRIIAGGMQSFSAATDAISISNTTNNKQPHHHHHHPTIASIACKRSRDGPSSSSTTTSNRPDGESSTKKPRMVFTEIQRRTLVAIFKEIKRPSKEIQVTIAEQLGLKVSTVVNFFMNARRRSVDKYVDDPLLLDRGDSINDAVSSTANATDESTG